MTRIRANAIVAAVAGATVLAAGPAAAAPGEVTATTSVSGSSVKVLVKNSSTKTIACDVVAATAPWGPSSPGAATYGDGSNGAAPIYGVISAGSQFAFTLHKIVNDEPTGTTVVADGTYDVYWVCGEVGATGAMEIWGSSELTREAHAADPSGTVDSGDAPKMTVTVPGQVTPEPPACSGSMCGVLPPDLARVFGS